MKDFIVTFLFVSFLCFSIMLILTFVIKPILARIIIRILNSEGVEAMLFASIMFAFVVTIIIKILEKIEEME